MPRRIAVMVMGLALAMPAVGQAGLLSYYTFSEVSGSVAHDSVGSVDGTLINAAAFAPGAGINGGGALSLTQSTNDLVTMGDHFNFTNQSFSVQAWVKLDRGDTDPMIVLSRHWATHVAGYLLAIGDIGDGTNSPPGTSHFYATYPTSGNSPGTVNDGEWHQLVGVYNAASAVVSIYVDGALASSSGGANVPLPSASAPFLLGGLQSAGGSLQGLFTGLMTNVGIWDNALTGAEIQSIYETTLRPVPEPATLSLVAFAGLCLLGRRAIARRR